MGDHQQPRLVIPLQESPRSGDSWGRAESWGLVGQGSSGCFFFPPDTRSSRARGHSSQAASSSGTKQRHQRESKTPAPLQGGGGGRPDSCGRRGNPQETGEERPGRSHPQSPSPDGAGRRQRPVSLDRRPRPPAASREPHLSSRAAVSRAGTTFERAARAHGASSRRSRESRLPVWAEFPQAPPRP